MEKFKVTFEANDQQLKSLGTKHASDTYADIEATFVLGSRWTDMDSVSAVWWNDFTKIATVLDSQGKCIVPHEVLTRKGYVRVNLVGSVVENGELVTRLTSYSAEAVKVNEKIKLTGSETSEITPSQYEQFVANVKADADRAEAGATESANSAQSASDSATASANSATSSAQSATASAQSAQNASESAISAENAKDDAIDARDEIRSMRANAETLEPNQSATASYSNGVLTLGIPKGDKGDTGDTGASAGFGTVSATVDGTTGTPSVEVTTSGTDTAKNFDFSFHNLKGAKGDKGDTGEVSLEDLEALLPTDTASGSIVTITDGQAIVPAKSLKVQLEPIQDLNGYDKPWVGGAGKNKLTNNYYEKSVTSRNGITYTVNDDGSITLQGTSTAQGVSNWEMIFTGSASGLKAGTYIISADGLQSGVQIIFGGNVSSIPYNTVTYQNTSRQFTLSSDDATLGYCLIQVNSGATINTTIYPMIRFATETDATYTPYSNICPISGRTEVVTYRTDEQLYIPSNTKIGKNWIMGNASDRAINVFAVQPNTKYKVYTSGGNFTDELFIEMNNNSQVKVTTIRSPYNDYITTSSNTNKIIIQWSSSETMTTSNFSGYQCSVSKELSTYTTSLGQTVYGGTLDVVSGVLTVDRAMVDLGTLTWLYSSTSGQEFFYHMGFDAKSKGSSAELSNAVCDSYEQVGYDSVNGNNGTFGISRDGTYLKVCNTNYTSSTDFKTAMSGHYICYELATPQTIQLTPQEVQLLLGTNNVWSDGDVTLVYSADIQKWVEKQLGTRSTLTMSRPMVQTETETETSTEETETETE